MRFRCLLFLFSATLLLRGELVTSPALAQACNDFNCYIRNAAEKVVRERGNLGWCSSGTFSRNLSFMPTGIIIDRKPTGVCKGNNQATSCNGAVFEVLVEALNRYTRERGSNSVTIATATWQKTTLADLRSHIFMYEPNEMPPFKEQKISIGRQEYIFNKDSNLQDFTPELRSGIRAFESKSIAHALSRFGLADPVGVAELKPGDVLTFNRDVRKVENG